MNLKNGHKKPLLKPGQILNGRWEVLKHIATGGKGEIYRARQPKLEREVAIKVVSQELIDAYDGDEEEIAGEMERFRREVLAMAATRHVNVLQVYDFEQATIVHEGREKTIDYIVMEYIPGDTLSATIPKHGLASDEEALQDWIANYFLPVLDGVEYIHAKGIVHRDIKPSNVLLDNEVPKIADFGLVGGGQWQPVTRSHHVIGTLAYMAPEQYMDLAEAGFRADIYSLGKMLYKAAVGVFDKDTMKPLQTASLPRHNTTLLNILDRVIQTATAQEPENRYASVGELRTALLQLPGLVPTMGVGRRKLGLALGLSALLAVLLAWGVWYHFQGIPPKQTAVTPPSSRTDAKISPGQPADEIKGRDGATLRLVPAGKTTDGNLVTAFYLETTMVTNHQFVEFLNAVKGSLAVVDGVVKGGGKPWLFLGEVRKGVEPIVYARGRFHIKDPALAAHPVVKVTAYGAAAYATRQGRRLPTPVELRLAAASPPAAAASSDTNHMAGMHGTADEKPSQPISVADESPYFPVIHYPPNKLGIRGLNIPMGSWARTGDGRSVVVEKGDKAKALEAWQGLDWVGFRTAMNFKNLPGSAASGTINNSRD